MQKTEKTLLVEMVLQEDGNWASSLGGKQITCDEPTDAANDDIPAAGEVSTLDAFSRLLSKRNLELLKLIKTAEPKSVAELARLSGRPKASLMLTLRRFNTYGIIYFDQSDGRRKIPRVMCDRLRLEIPIA